MTDPSLELARQVRALARKVSRLEKDTRTQARASQARHRSVEGGTVTVYDADGNPRTVIGEQPDGTFTWQDVNGPPPPAPASAGITVTALPGALAIEWDGTYEDESAAPGDFLHVEVHRDVSAGYAATELTQRATMPSSVGGTVTLPVEDPAAAQYVKLVTVSTSYAESVPSAELEVFALPPGEDPSDGLAPATAPDLEVSLGYRGLNLLWMTVPNPDPVHYEVAGSTSSGAPEDKILLFTVTGNARPVTSWAGAPLAMGQPYYFQVRAVDADGPGPWSVEKSETPRRILGSDLEQGTITGNEVSDFALTVRKLTETTHRLY